MNSSVYDKIISNAKEEALLIKEQGKIKADSMTEQIMNENNLRMTQVMNDAKKKCENNINKCLSSLEQNKKQKVLNHQKQLIKDTFNFALNELIKLNDQDLIKYVTNNLNKTKLIGGETILVNSNDYQRYLNLFSTSNNTLDKLFDNKYNLILSKNAVDIKGGFIIETKYYDIDYSYEAVLSQVEETYETKIASMLFGKGE